MFERPSKKTVVGIIGGALAIVTIFAIAKNCDSGPAVDYEGPPNSNGETGTSTETNIVPREKRLLDLDDIFRKQGTEAWLKAAGFTYESIELSARQPEEELHNGSTVATGFQVEAKGLSVNYPAGLTTDQPVNGNCVKPDLDNPSQVCTNVETFTGKATLYVDIQNWSQLAPKK